MYKDFDKKNCIMLMKMIIYVLIFFIFFTIMAYLFREYPVLMTIIIGILLMLLIIIYFVYKIIYLVFKKNKNQIVDENTPINF
jgi:glucan phosphoethanolaminetransferase (alkaline phosphatase superfamily)